MTTPRTHILSTARDIALNIVEWGDPAAPPLILQHGGRDHARSWDFVAAAFADRFRVIAPDLRGHGDSGWSNDGSYDLIDHVQDFATLVDALGLPPCAMVGHSLGGNILTRFAGMFPERVTRLINIEGLGDSPQRAAERAARDQVAVLREWIGRRMHQARFVPKRHADIAAIEALLAGTDARLPPAMIAHLATHATRRNDDGSYSFKYDPALRGLPPVDISEATRRQLWAAIACPVLLVYGAESWASNPAADGRAAHFRDARVELFDDAGHWVHHDRQADFIATAAAFLG